jgi:hypothetical protein
MDQESGHASRYWSIINLKSNLYGTNAQIQIPDLGVGKYGNGVHHGLPVFLRDPLFCLSVHDVLKRTLTY